MRLSNLNLSLVVILLISITICTHPLYADGLTLYDVQFIDSEEGWAVGVSGLIIHTTDGGNSWEQQYTGTTDILWSVCFVDAENGWAVGQYMRILNTTDGGNIWTTQNSEDTCSLQEVHFINSNEGWAVGSCGKILHTADGGNNWTEQNVGTTDLKLYSVYFTDNLHGWTGGLGKVLYRTTDGGEAWELLQPYVYTNITYRGIQFTDNLNGWRTGGGTSYTTDGGINWTSSTDYSGYDLQMLDEENGYVVGSLSHVLKTTNGRDWSLTQIGYINRLYGVSFTDDMTGWIVGEYGLILHTTDGGVNWVRQGNGSIESRIFSNSDTLLLFISDLELVTDVIEVDILEKVMQTYSLVEVEVSIDTVLHSSVSDLEFYLTHGGITDTLIHKSSCNGENFIRTTFSDIGSNSISSGTAPFTGIYSPDQPLSRFTGMNPNGEWILGIYDGETGNTGTFKGWSLTLYFETTVNVDNEPAEIIQTFELHQNYPNPFNPSTTIKWQMPKAGLVALKIYDVLGREVVTLVNEELNAENHETVFDASRFSSGIYFYQLKVEDFIQTKKMILLK